MSAIIILLSGIVITALYYFWPFNYWKKRGVYTLKPNVLFGNLSGVILRKVPAYRMFKEVYTTCKARRDKFIGFYFFYKPSLVIVDPELLKNVFAKDFNSFTDRMFYLNEEDPLSVNIVSAKGDQWKKMRDQLNPAFSPSKLKNVFPTLLQVGDQLKMVLDKSVENCEVVDLDDVSTKYVADAIGMSIFGIESNTLQNSNVEFRNNAEKIFGGSLAQNIKLLVSILCPSLLFLFKIPFISYDIQKFYLNLIKMTVEHRENNNIERRDLMHSIIQLRNNIDIEKETKLISFNIGENEKSLKIEEITAQAVMFMGAAYETTASTISLCMYELAVNLEVQNELRKEIENTLTNHGRKLSYDVIMNMTYLDKCVSEALRKYALTVMISRICTEKYKLPKSDLELDVGSTVYIPVYEIHHDPEYYPHPEKFDPERFSPENKSKRPSFTFLSLGEGQRHCIGGRLGVLKVKIFLVTFLRNYNFTINWRTQLPPALDQSKAIVCFEKPLYLNVEKLRIPTDL